MDPAYYVAAGSLKARSMQMDALSNNLANISTTGFKSERTFFSIFNKAQQEGRDLPMSRYVNDGTVLANRGTDFSQGPLQATGRALDLAVEGQGFFVLQTPAGLRLTRDGRFQLGQNGQIEAADGSPLLGKNGQPLRVDPQGGPLTIAPDGALQQDGKALGEVDLRTYTTPQAFTREGAGRFNPGSAQPLPATAKVNQGFLEGSGADMASALVDMIRINRLFEMSMKVAATLSNDLDARALNDIAMQR